MLGYCSTSYAVRSHSDKFPPSGYIVLGYFVQRAAHVCAGPLLMRNTAAVSLELRRDAVVLATDRDDWGDYLCRTWFGRGNMCTDTVYRVQLGKRAGSTDHASSTAGSGASYVYGASGTGSAYETLVLRGCAARSYATLRPRMVRQGTFPQAGEGWPSEEKISAGPLPSRRLVDLQCSLAAWQIAQAEKSDRNEQAEIAYSYFICAMLFPTCIVPAGYHMVYVQDMPPSTS